MEDWKAQALVMQEMFKHGKIRTVVGNVTRVGENFRPFQLHVTNTHHDGTIFKVKGVALGIMVQSTLSRYWTYMGRYSVVECTLITKNSADFVPKNVLEGAEFKIY